MNTSLPIGSASAKAALAASAEKYEDNKIQKIQDQLSAAKGSKNEGEIWKAAEGFEQIFLTILMRQMRLTVFETEDSLDSSNASKTYREMFDEQISRLGSKTHTFGLAKMIHDSLTRDLTIGKNKGVKMSSEKPMVQEPTPLSGEK